MVGPPKINNVVHNQLDMLWDRSVDGQPQEKHSPKKNTRWNLLWFLLVFLVILVILGLIFLPGLFSSHGFWVSEPTFGLSWPE